MSFDETNLERNERLRVNSLSQEDRRYERDRESDYHEQMTLVEFYNKNFTHLSNKERADLRSKIEAYNGR